jgi:hypothetical protein
VDRSLGSLFAVVRELFVGSFFFHGSHSLRVLASHSLGHSFVPRHVGHSLDYFIVGCCGHCLPFVSREFSCGLFVRDSK